MSSNSKHVTLALAGVASLLLVTISPILRPVPVAAPVPVEDVRHHLQLQQAGCQVMLDTATTRAQKERANACLSDTARALKVLESSPAPTPTASPTVSPTPGPSPSPTVGPTGTPTPTTTPTPSPTPSNSSCALPAYPRPDCTGVPAGWTPVTTIPGDMTVTQDGQVVDGYLIKGTLFIRAQNVTVKNSMVYGQIYNQVSNQAFNGLFIQDTTVGPPTGILRGGTGAIGVCGYTALRVQIRNTTEGFRVGGYGDSGGRCGRVTIMDSFVKLVQDGDVLTHADGIQEYDGIPGGMTVIHNTIDAFIGQPEANAAIAVGAAGYGGTFRDNLTSGGGFVLRFLDIPGPGATFPEISGNRVVKNSWGFGPADVDKCSSVGIWRDNRVAVIDSSYRVTSLDVRIANCPETP